MKKKGIGEQLKTLFAKGKIDEEFYEEIEEILIEGDIGARETMEIVDELKKRAHRANVKDEQELQQLLKELLKEYVYVEPLEVSSEGMDFFLILGVNGVGKTTTIAKLVEYFVPALGREKIILSAGDTFRAAAIDQLKLHAERVGVHIVTQAPGADPGAVIFDTIDSGVARGTRLVLADTAGRMHNKAHLVRELQKIDKIIVKKIERERYKKILVIDATTGQNGFRQAEIFHEAIGVDSIILAKFDSTAKGGIVIPISRRLGIPFSLLGTGEKYTDLVPFDKDKYLDGLLGIE